MSLADDRELSAALKAQYPDEGRPRRGVGTSKAFRTDKEVAAALAAAVGTESVDDPAELFAKALGGHVEADKSAPSGAEIERRMAGAEVEAPAATDEAAALEAFRKMVVEG